MVDTTNIMAVEVYWGRWFGKERHFKNIIVRSYYKHIQSLFIGKNTILYIVLDINLWSISSSLPSFVIIISVLRL
jgi:hypothetical protein